MQDTRREVGLYLGFERGSETRDFTINAMAYSHEDGDSGYFRRHERFEGGCRPLCRQCVERFTEDALRIPACHRFSAQLNFTIEDETYAALTVIAPNLANVSKERIQAELTKTLLSDHPERILLVEETGMSLYIGGFSLGVWDQHRQGEGSL